MSRRAPSAAVRRRPRRPERRVLVGTQERNDGSTFPQPLAEPVPLGAVLTVVAVVIAAVVALALMTSRPVPELHDSWINVPVHHRIGEVHDSWMPTLVPANSEIHDSWMNSSS